MALEDILKPFRMIDEEILHQYTKISNVRGLNDSKSKYEFAFFVCQVPTEIIRVVLNRSYPDYNMFFHSTQDLHIPVEYNIVRTVGVPIMMGGIVDMIQNWYGLVHYHSTKDTDVKIKDMFEERCKSITKKVRLPTVLVAGVNLGMAISEMYQSVAEQKPISPEFYFYLNEAVLYGGVASSIYLKDTDTTLLQKDPLWKRIYTTIKEKVTTILPQPLPQPVAVQYKI